MIFQHTYPQMDDGSKWQSRRLVQPGETSGPYRKDEPESETNRAVYTAAGSLKWHTGMSLAIQPGRGLKAGFHRTVIGLRRERVRDITEADAQAECGALDHGGSVSWVDQFSGLWEAVHGEYAWHRNEDVWVIVFARDR